MPQQLIPFWNAFKKWWWLLLISAGLAGFSAYYVSSRQSSLYQATVTLRVGAGIAVQNTGGFDYGASVVQTYENFVRLRPITQAVINKLDLDITPEQLASQIATRTIGQAQILEITLFASDPEVASQLADAVAQELISQTTPASEQAINYDYVREELSKTLVQIGEIDAQIRELREEMLQMTSAADLAEAQQRLEGLTKNQSDLRNYYLQLAELNNSRSSGALSVIVPAIPNSNPLGPNPRRDALLGLVGGVLLAVGAIVLLEFTDNALRWGDITLENSLPMLGIVPAMPRRKSPLIVHSQPNSPEADAVRSLRTRIFLIDTGRMIKRLLITSPTPRDGKSFTTVNLAVAAADAGLRVIIVDGDIRAGTIHQYFGLEREPGLTNLLWNRSSEKDSSLSLLRRTSISNLHVLTTGTHARDPLMLLRSPRLKELMDDLSERADLIIIDSPPVVAGPYTTLLSAVADGIVLVASIDRTNRKLYNATREELNKNSEAPLLGLALNRIALGKLGPELGVYGYGFYGQPQQRGRIGKIRRLPGAVSRLIRRSASANGQGQAGWLEDTPGDLSAEPIEAGIASAETPAGRLTADASMPAMGGDANIMTVTEVAAQLEVPEEVIEEWCRTGQLPAVRIGKRWLVTGLSRDFVPPEPAVAPEPNGFDLAAPDEVDAFEPSLDLAKEIELISAEPDAPDEDETERAPQPQPQPAAAEPSPRDDAPNE